MARSSSTDKKAKEPGRLKQMFQVFQMTRKADPSSVWWFALAFVGPVVLGVLLALLLPGQNWLAIVLWIVAGVLLGVLLFLIVLGRLAERAAYSQIEGQPGAVGGNRGDLARSAPDRVGFPALTGRHEVLDP